MFNSKIEEMLDQFGIERNEGLTYLLCIYYKVKPVCISEEIQARVGITEIFRKKGDTIAWLIPLFVDKKFDDNWDWVVEEYCSKFQKVNEQRGMFLVESIERMKQLFVQNINLNLTKQDILEAADLYLSTVDEPQYCKACHYFISKGIGQNRERMILGYIDEARRIRKKSELSKENKYPTLE